ncbi:MAG: AAA family ATPase [Rhodocyclaceae bacterium]
MKHETVLVNNVKRVLSAATALTQPGAEQKFSVWHGPAGLGKTTAATVLATRFDAVFVRALAVWTPTAMLHTICAELQINDPSGRKWQMVEAIMRALDANPRPIIVDESDHIAGEKQNIETLRDLHDMCGVPIILIGMEGLKKALERRKQVASRVGSEIEFKPLSQSDAELVTRQLCEVKIAEDLQAKLFDACQGSIRSLKVGLASIETRARAIGAATMTLKDWGDKPFFFAQSKHKPLPRPDQGEQGKLVAVA